MTSPRLTPEQGRALQLLASSRYGINEEQFVHGHVFSRRVLAELVRAGFAGAEREVIAGSGEVEVVRVKITATGRRALERERRATATAGARRVIGRKRERISIEWEHL